MHSFGSQPDRHGLNIFHIDESRSDNSNDSRRLVDVEPGDGSPVDSGRGENSDLWYPGSAMQFDAFSTPNSDLSGGGTSEVDVHSISGSSMLMTATFGNARSGLPGDVAPISPQGGIADDIPSDPSAGGAGSGKIGNRNGTEIGARTDPMEFVVGTDGGEGGQPGKVALISPQGGIADDTPTYTWGADPNATEYKLRVDDASGNKRIMTWYTAGEAGCADGTGTCSLTPSYPLAGGAGSWRIKTRNDTEIGVWSDPMEFVTGSGSKTPDADSVMVLTWDANPAAEKIRYYEIMYGSGERRIDYFYTRTSNAENFDPDAPSVDIAISDLAKVYDGTVCFVINAYNDWSESKPSAAVCASYERKPLQ
ncbi:MAG: hypothetical protein U9R74_07600 [Pseudomonadota bacterium]|nr:hypothetical protein [Pseudomonadota bacterium]